MRLDEDSISSFIERHADAVRWGALLIFFACMALILATPHIK